MMIRIAWCLKSAVHDMKVLTYQPALYGVRPLTHLAQLSIVTDSSSLGCEESLSQQLHRELLSGGARGLTRIFLFAKHVPYY